MYDFSKFTKFANIVLSSLLGILIFLPLNNPSLIFIGLILGFLIGYRRKTSRAFFYLVLFSVSIMTCIVYLQILKN